MSYIPPQPIEKIYIHFQGDRSVGIPSADFEMSVYIDFTVFSEPEDVLEDTRTAVEDLYKNIQGETPSYVMFDFEYKKMLEMEKEQDRMSEEDLKEEMSNYQPRKSMVKCYECEKKFDSESVEFLNIESDIQERDIMTFRCPCCKQEKKSLIFV